MGLFRRAKPLKERNVIPGLYVGYSLCQGRTSTIRMFTDPCRWVPIGHQWKSGSVVSVTRLATAQSTTPRPNGGGTSRTQIKAPALVGQVPPPHGQFVHSPSTGAVEN